MTTNIPLVDLRAQHREIADEVMRGLGAVFENTSFILGKHVAEFEGAFAQYSHVAHCVGVANGTDALELALRAAGVGAGDEVILPANTFIATALAVVRAGATPRLVDCDAATQLIDPTRAADAVGPRTKALLPVHLFGQMAPMAPLEALAREAGALLLEDAAQSQGAAQDGRTSGSIGLVAGTSFYPGKNLGAYGDAGAVLTMSDEIAKKVRALRNYGSEVKYHHPELGFNSRLDTMQAVVLSAKLKRLEAWNDARRAAARRYHELLADLPGVGLPETAPGNLHVWHLYVVRVARRDEVLARLNAAGIGAGIHYPVPIHLQGAFAHLGHKPGAFPAAEAAAREILSLPLHPHLTAADQERVAAELRRAVS
jgi:dTDP-4-amino-4,6-dideoxygalactose transaminase